MSNLAALFWRDESGATAIEYGLIATLVAIGLLSGLIFFGDSVTSMFSSIEGATRNAMGGP